MLINPFKLYTLLLYFKGSSFMNEPKTTVLKPVSLKMLKCCANGDVGDISMGSFIMSDIFLHQRNHLTQFSHKDLL